MAKAPRGSQFLKEHQDLTIAQSCTSQTTSKMRTDPTEIVNGVLHKEAKISDANEDQKVEELRKAIGPLTGTPAIFCQDDCLRRYLRARQWNVKKAEKFLKESLAWRAKFKPEELRWDHVAKEGETGKIYRTNFHDKLGRTVLIMCPGRQNTNDHDGQMKHLAYCLENAILSLTPGTEKIVWLIDFRGWTLAKNPPLRTSMETLNILQNQYPERLGAAICYDPPHMFQTFWRIIRPFIDPVTYQKIKFIYSNQPDAMKFLEETFDLEVLEKTFGGRSTWEFNFEEYSNRMRQDDLKAEAFWRHSPSA